MTNSMLGQLRNAEMTTQLQMFSVVCCFALSLTLREVSYLQQAQVGYALGRAGRGAGFLRGKRYRTAGAGGGRREAFRTGLRARSD